jgi:hypothetical protein
MWVTEEVELPDVVLDALRGDRLAVFVGAGASVDEPSKLPLFSELATSIGREALVLPTEEEMRRPDEFLGRLQDVGVDVRRRVASKLQSSVDFNPLHEAIVGLFGRRRPARIVTTNYDRHLSGAARSVLGVDPPTFEAPALPSGSDFHGIAHLHGSLRQDAQHLIVTDHDFGRAYLRQGWATRFLNDLFSKYVVLFVGYSHEDMVMRYLARALGEESPRFALVSDLGDRRRWETLNIEVATYPEGPANDHGALTRAVGALGVLARMTLVQHDGRLRGLTEDPPTTRVDLSYLGRVLSDEHAVKLWARYASGPAWLTWVATTPQFAQMLQARAPADSVTETLAYWFADQCLSMELALVEGSPDGVALGEALALAIADRLHRQNRPRGVVFAAWATKLLQSRHRGLLDLQLEQVLYACKWEEDAATTLSLLEHLLWPAVSQRPWALAAGLYSDVSLQAEGYWLSKAWSERIRPHLDECATDVAMMCVTIISVTHARLASMAASSSDFDPLSAGRSAIEEHDQDQYEGSTKTLIDAARDSLVELLKVNVTLGDAIVDHAARSGVPLLRRLAVHAWAERPDRSPDEKIAWLLAHGMIFDLPLRHEVFRVLALSAGSAARSSKETLSAAVRAGLSADEPEVRAYEVFNVFAWLHMSHPDDEYWQAEFGRAQEENPEFGVREHPDFTSWIGEVELVTPVDTSELVNSEPEEAITMLQRVREDEADDWLGLRHVGESLTTVVSNSPAWGLRLGHELASRQAWASDEWEHLIRGWAYAELGDSEWAEVLSLLHAHPTLVRHGRPVAQLLSKSEDRGLRVPQHLIAQAVSVARRLVETAGEEDVEPDSDGWLSAAINHWVGDLAQFMLSAAAALREADREGWSGFPPDVRALATELVTGPGVVGAYARPVFGGNAHWLRAVDPSWTTEFVVPTFDWTNEDHAAQSWDGFLSWGRWNLELVRALGVQFVAMFEHMQDRLPRRIDRITEHAVVLFTSDPAPPLPADWFVRLVSLLPEERRVTLAGQIGRRLRQLGNLADTLWESKIEPYWQMRVDGVPRRISTAEGVQMLLWSTCFDAFYPAAAELARRTDLEADRFYGWFSDGRLPELAGRYPSTTADLVLYALERAVRYFFDGEQLEALWAQFAHSGDVDSETLDEIRSEAIRLGLLDAASWAA